MTVSVDPTDLNYVKALSGMCTGAGNCFLTAETGAITDMVDIPIQEATVSSVIVGVDTTAPTLYGFKLDMTAETLELSFDEYVNTDTLAITRITVSSASMNESHTLQRRRNVTQSVNGPVIITLATSDVDGLKLKLVDAAASTVVVTALSGMIADMNDRPVSATTLSVTDADSSFIGDSTRPNLIAFAVNMNTSRISFVFDEPVNSDTFTPTAVTLQASNSASANSITLSGGTALSANGRQIIIGMTVDDANRVKRLEALFVDRSSSWLSLGQLTMRDMANEHVNSIASVEALQATQFIEDQIAPLMTRFDLDMDGGYLTIYFAETMNASSLDIGSITLQQGASDVVSAHTLGQGSSWDMNNDSTVIVIALSLVDMNILKQLDIGLGRSSSWLTITEAGIYDMNRRPSIALLDGVSALQASVHTPDGTNPTLTGFDLDMSTGHVVLSFSETVSTSTTFDATAITFQSASNVANSVSSISVSLNNTSTSSTPNGPFVVLVLSTADLNELKRIDNLADADNTTFISFSSALVADAQHNTIVGRATSDAVDVTEFVADDVNPQLSSFDFDMATNLAVLTFSFSETMRAATLDPTVITVHSDTESFQLTGGDVSSADSDVLTVSLTEGDLNGIKELLDLAQSQLTTKVTFPEPFVADMNTNLIIAATGVVATGYVPDTTAPALVSFRVDLDLEVLYLTFSETVDSSSVAAERFQLQNAACAGFSGAVRLDSSSPVSQNDSTAVTIGLSHDTLRNLKQDRLLAKNTSTTYLKILSNAVLDTASQANTLATSTCDCSTIAVALCLATQASTVVNDATDPELVDWVLNMDYTGNTGYILLTFNEPMDPLTITTSAISLHTEVQLPSYTLGTSSVEAAFHTAAYNYEIIKVVISDTDMNNIKFYDSIGKSLSQSWLTFGSDLGTDMADNTVVAVSSRALTAAPTFTADGTGPVLLDAQLNMATGALMLSFSETINKQSFNFSAVTLLSGPTGSTGSVASVRFGVAELVESPTPSTSLGITIRDQDLDLVKVVLNLGTEQSDSYIAMDSTAIRDFQGNFATATSASNPLLVSNYTADSVPPTLASFSLSMDAGQLHLTFAEAVSWATLRPAGLVLQDAEQASALASGSYRLRVSRHSAVAAVSSTVITVNLTSNDLNHLKRMTGMATAPFNTFVRIDASSIDDMNGNAIEAVADGAAIRASSLVVDSTDAELVDFSVAMATNGPPLKLRLTFSETVDIGRLDLTKLILQSLTDGTDPAGETFRLTGGTVAAVPLPDPDEIV
jgi:hypothetical protein